MEISKVIEEIERIPPNRLAEVYSFIHFFRLGIESESLQSNASELGLNPEQSPLSNYDFSALAGHLTWQGNAVMRIKHNATTHQE
jgi:hypothetical protein